MNKREKKIAKLLLKKMEAQLKLGHSDITTFNQYTELMRGVETRINAEAKAVNRLV